MINNSNKIIEIEFKTEQDRIKGVADMIRSTYTFRSYENHFLVHEEMLPELSNNSYNIIEVLHISC